MTKLDLTPIHPIILSGGSGTRLWPLSRSAYPKQLLSLTGENSLLQSTILRSSKIPNTKPPIIICNQEHRFLVREQCQKIATQPEAIYLEPTGKNTAPAIAIAAMHLAYGEKPKPDALMLILPADHIVNDEAEFINKIEIAKKAAIAEYLVTFGIKPTHPETGYGYIKIGEEIQSIENAFKIEKFIEKPNKEIAETYYSTGEFNWNSGMFIFRADRYLTELKIYRPDIFEAANKIWNERTTDLEFTRFDSKIFSECPSESIDYAIMQSSNNSVVVPADIGWSDVGSWDALWNIAEKNEHNNALIGDVFSADSKNTYARAESKLVALIGVENLVVIETRDAVLVMNKERAQDIKKAIEHFKKSNRHEQIEHQKIHRPWGWYEKIDEGHRFQVKRIMVKPGEKLSLQMHHHRAEHWIVVSGTAKVTISDKTFLLSENESTFIPLGKTHRLENPGKLPLHLIEVQSGSYLNEDDIVRLEDIYSRERF